MKWMVSAAPPFGVAALFIAATGPTAAAGQAGLDARAADMTAGESAAEGTGVIDVHRLTQPITLDGLSTEAAWQDVEPFPLTMYEPTFRGSSDRRIQVLVAYDDDALYVAGRFFHDDPNEIRAFSLTRDRWSGDDSFGVLLDTFNDNENGLRFVGLPLGSRMDMTITGGGADGDRGGRGGAAGGPRGTSWNAFWDLETVITDEGWFGEIRIPFSSLRFESESDGSVVMGLMAYASEPLRGVRWTFPAVPRTFPYTQITQWQKVRFNDIEPRNPVYVTPYGLTGGSRQSFLNEAGDGWERANEQQYEVGGDVKLNPTPNLTLDLTANTDFAAVEADQQQVNLTRFSLFFDEKRPFFQERAGIFGFDAGAERGTLFYSRRIGLVDGQPIPIYGGARLVGRVGSWDLGLISMQTAAVDDLGLASENFGVLRLKRRVLNESSFLGAMSTSRVEAGGAHNITYGLDGLLRVAGDEYLTVKWLQTFQGGDLASDAAPGGLDAGSVVLDWTRRRQGGLSYQHAFTFSGAGYNPGVGFESRDDFMRVQSDWNYQWFPHSASSFRTFWIGTIANAWTRNSDDELETLQFQPFVQLETKPGATIKFSTNTQFEDVLAGFDLSEEVQIPIGSYWATEGAAEFRAPRGWTFAPNLTFTGGEFFDGQRVGVKVDLNWSVNQHLGLVGGVEWNRIRFDERGQEFDSNLARLTARGAFNTELSVDAFVQYNSLSDALTTNTRLRYNFREGQDLWLVWNEGLNLEREVFGQPPLPLEDARTLTLKYTHTFIF